MKNMLKPVKRHVLRFEWLESKAQGQPRTKH
jgi:hypothetical protein